MRVLGCVLVIPLLTVSSVQAWSLNRRAWFGAAAASLVPSAAHAALGSKDSVVQREINTFNSLIYNFKNNAIDGGLDASKISEPSIPFLEFGEKMKNGEVTFVEFLAPSGQVAYATLKNKKRLRIGQGYPTGAKNSWSSPDFVIRSVSNYGVPYKFTVPALAKYSKK